MILRLIRWQNIALIWLTQILFFYLYIKPYCGIDNNTLGILLSFLGAMATTIAGGNILNDLFDQKTDQLNPHKFPIVGKFISVPQAWRLYIICLFLTLLLSLWGYYYIESIAYLIYFLAISIALYLYSKYLKSTILIGNFLVALLSSSAIWSTTLLIPNCVLTFQPGFHDKTHLIFWGYIILGFFVHTLREVIKDLEDKEPDQKAEIVTVARLQKKYVLMILNIILGLLLTTIIIGLFKIQPYVEETYFYIGASLFLLPALVVGLLFNFSHRSNTYAFLSKLIKIYIIFSLLILILWQK